MKKSKWILPVSIVGGVLVLCVAAVLIFGIVFSANGYGLSTGRLYFGENGTYLIDDDNAMLVSDRSAGSNLFEGCQSGDKVVLLHGGVEESYPSRTGGYRIFRLSKGDETYKPADEVLAIGRTEDADIYDFYARYIRTDGYHEDVDYPVVTVIHSVEELNAYYETNKALYDLERRTTVYSDTSIGFLDACDKYDDAYFEDQVLVMVLLEEGSGSTKHKVQSVAWSEQNKKLTVYIESIVPEVGTDDMAEWHILVEPESIVKVDSGDDVTVIFDGVDPHTQPTTASHSRGYANIRLTVLNGWKYTTEDVEGSNDFSIVFWHESSADNKIRVSYQPAFGVCGTGLEEKDITISFYPAWQGTYDNHKNWDYISLKDMPGSYVILYEADDGWWKEHKEEAMQILNTLVAAENIITETEAIAIAKDNATVDYNEVRASFDMEKGEWSVTLYKKNTAGGDQTVIITFEGKVIDNIYGE